MTAEEREVVGVEIAQVVALLSLELLPPDDAEFLRTLVVDDTVADEDLFAIRRRVEDILARWHKSR
jgi:hypothetical protein